jgi:hypothetical protein
MLTMEEKGTHTIRDGARCWLPPCYSAVFRPRYFEAIDLAIACVKDRFDQPGYRVLQNVENLLIKAARPLKTDYTRELGFVWDFCGNDINRDMLYMQIQLLRSHFDKSENSTSCHSTWHFEIYVKTVSTFLWGRCVVNNFVSNACYLCYQWKDILGVQKN